MKRLLTWFCVAALLCSALAPTASAQSLDPGTEIKVQLVDQLDTGKAQTGDDFSATLSEAISMPSGAVWPKGTQVKGKVVDVVSSGRLSRPASITLEMTQIGNAPIDTEAQQIDGKSHAGHDAALIGGGAALGAIIGGITGGGKGAAIGTVAGASAGTVTAAATGKKEIVLKAETPLTFVVANEAAKAPEPGPTAMPASEAYAPAPASDAYGQQPDFAQNEPYAPEQLDNLLAPIALYPDPLLAQVLLASTFPDQIQDAAQRVRANDFASIDYQPWDVSVKAVAHYPTVLMMLSDRFDWTTALGQAYVYQSTDVMGSVQRLRNLAYLRGNLVTTPQQQVIAADGYIQIVPAQPRLIFVPTYDPGVIYVRSVYRPGFGYGAFFDFGRGFEIGVWLNHDLDWSSHRVVYDGWDRHDNGWRERSQPYVHVTNVYVDHRYEEVHVNHEIVNRRVDYDNLKRYNQVHPEVSYENRQRIEPHPDHGQAPRDAHEARLQPSNEHERVGDNRGDDHGVRNEQSFQPQPSPGQSMNAHTPEHTNPVPGNAAQPRQDFGHGPADDRGNAQAMHNQQAFQAQASPAQTSNPPVPTHTNPAPANAGQTQLQPSHGPADDKGKGHGSSGQQGFQSQRSTPQRSADADSERPSAAPSNNSRDHMNHVNAPEQNLRSGSQPATNPAPAAHQASQNQPSAHAQPQSQPQGTPADKGKGNDHGKGEAGNDHKDHQ